MIAAILTAVAVLVPLVALAIEHAGNVRITERHHAHHDTYVVPVSFTRSLVLAMVFMGVVGLLLSWACGEQVLLASPVQVLCFFDAFLLTCLVLWGLLCRYRVSTFRDCMVISPFFGHERWVRYEDIERLEWSGVRMESGYRTLKIWAGGRRAARLYGLVDTERVLMTIDRFDLLPRTL